ncbi:hypothetical protein [Moraxella oblonga]|uniref:hypothetical protein n=1 Tax=Moraxella oblonga TaxID=200413 RepID=UPI00082EFB4C|nr:hypothetical protein [Moraxella oblonga]
MNSYKYLFSLVEKTKVFISENPDSITFCKINDPLSSNNINDIATDHQKIFEIFNGGRFGIIDIWDKDFLSQIQYRVPNNNVCLYEVGQILYKPIFFNKSSNTILLTVDDDFKSIDTNLDFYEFTLHYIFGSGYSSLVQNDEADLWLNFINDFLARRLG